MFCKNCGKQIPDNAVFCTYCGAQTGIAQPGYQQSPYQQPSYQQSDKNRIAAGLFGILLGGLGIHKFYLGKVGLGIVYILFCWSGIPSIIGLVEGIIYLTSSDEEFYNKYVRQ